MTDDLCIENTHAHLLNPQYLHVVWTHTAHGIVYMYVYYMYMYTCIHMYMCVLYNIRLIPCSATCI